MTVLLDTNAFYWAVTGSTRLTGTARRHLQFGRDELAISPLLAYELSQKKAKGKLDLSLPPREFVRVGMEQLNAVELPLRLAHTNLSESIGWHHKDPFDRLLALQCLGERIPIVSSDDLFERYGVRRIW